MTPVRQEKSKKSKRQKTEDIEANVRKENGVVSGKVRLETWEEDGEVVRYNLAYINHIVCQQDNGRVLGYDNAHGHHERHYMGAVTQAEFESYDKTFKRFRAEVKELKETQND